MTRKHFKALAEATSKLKNDNAKAYLVDKMCKTFIELNPRFDSVKFIRACYVSPEVYDLEPCND